MTSVAVLPCSSIIPERQMGFDDPPMTAHIILTTEKRDELVWVTDSRIGLGEDNVADGEKIAHLEDHNLAISAWGEHALRIRNELIKKVIGKEISITANQTVSTQKLEAFACAEMKDGPRMPGSTKAQQGIIAINFDKPRPTIYCATPYAIPMWDIQFAGDPYNPARFFIAKYYRMFQGKGIEALLLLGIHAMMEAASLKKEYLGSPNAWVFRNGNFGNVGVDELLHYKRLSEALSGHELKALSEVSPIG